MFPVLKPQEIHNFLQGFGLPAKGEQLSHLLLTNTDDLLGDLLGIP